MFARSLPVSIAVHLAALVLLFIIPLAAEVVLPLPPSRLPPYVKAVAVPPPPAPPPAAVAPARLRTLPTSPLVPVTAPPAILPEVAPPVAPSAITDPFGMPGPPVDTGGIGVRADPIDAMPRPAPPPAGPVRAGDLLVAPKKIVDARPTYPEIARILRVQGTVVLEAVLDRAGRVSQVRVARSVPLLDQAAIDAVRQWRYTPTVLHGQPVEVLMTITMTFQLQ